ncbi:hypothetical protein ANTPLA_LOCUS3231 [Anthophora plagiata]
MHRVIPSPADQPTGIFSLSLSLSLSLSSRFISRSLALSLSRSLDSEPAGARRDSSEKKVVHGVRTRARSKLQKGRKEKERGGRTGAFRMARLLGVTEIIDEPVTRTVLPGG